MHDLLHCSDIHLSSLALRVPVNYKRTLMKQHFTRIHNKYLIVVQLVVKKGSLLTKYM